LWLKGAGPARQWKKRGEGAGARVDASWAAAYYAHWVEARQGMGNWATELDSGSEKETGRRKASGRIPKRGRKRK